ncbi:hypothetical protein PvNV_095 [Penaeus vannamei nudivirus]|nr:hypothetical protein PvSNPV_095 [Penaeus vannamei nucleopolyhedrovirus]
MTMNKETLIEIIDYHETSLERLAKRSLNIMQNNEDISTENIEIMFNLWAQHRIAKDQNLEFLRQLEEDENKDNDNDDDIHEVIKEDTHDGDDTNKTDDVCIVIEDEPTNVRRRKIGFTELSANAIRERAAFNNSVYATLTTLSTMAAGLVALAATFFNSFKK